MPRKARHANFRFPDQAAAEEAVLRAEITSRVIAWLYLGRVSVSWKPLPLEGLEIGYVISPRKTSEYILEMAGSGIRVYPFEDWYRTYSQRRAHMIDSARAMALDALLAALDHERRSQLAA